MADDGVCELCGVEGGLRLVAKVPCTDALFECKEECILNNSCVFRKAQVPQHGQATQQEGRRISDVFTGNIGRCAMDGFKNGDVITNIGRRSKSKTAYESSTEV